MPATYAECRQVCTGCRIGFSHSKTSRTFIREDWRDGLWRPQAATRLDWILQHALNKLNRANKRRRIANERSEDLLTWNFFSWLEDHKLLGGLLTMAGVPDGGSGARIFYWGVNDRYELRDLPGLLAARFDERPLRLSEPDILLVGDSSVVVIEAKLGSPNNRLQGKAKPVSQYAKAVAGWFRDLDAASTAQYYELVRNWALGAVMAEHLQKHLAVINLVPEHHEPDIERTFGQLLSDKGRFRRLTWERCAQALAPSLLSHLARETSYFKPVFPSLQAGPGPVSADR